MPSTFLKDPDAVLDYKFDWAALTNGSGDSDWLGSGETISTFTLTVDSGLTRDSEGKTDTNTSITFWLSGGTAGVDYAVACKIVTSDSRTDERTMKFQVRQR